MANELQAAEGFLYGKLHGSALLTSGTHGVFSGSAPRGTPPPFVVFGYQGSQDVGMVNLYRLGIEPLYLVRVMGQTGRFSDIEPFADEIDRVLHKSSGTYNGYRIAQCVREDVYSLVDTSEEIPWRYLGGYYRLYIVGQVS